MWIINSWRQFFLSLRSVQWATHQPKGVCVFSREIHSKGLEESHPPQRHHAQVCTHQILHAFIGYKPHSLLFIQQNIFFIACFMENSTFWWKSGLLLKKKFNFELDILSKKCFIKRRDFQTTMMPPSWLKELQKCQQTCVKSWQLHPSKTHY